jgi:hypothetical protein
MANGSPPHQWTNSAAAPGSRIDAILSGDPAKQLQRLLAG